MEIPSADIGGCLQLVGMGIEALEGFLIHVLLIDQYAGGNWMGMKKKPLPIKSYKKT